MKSGAACPLRAHCSAGGRACSMDSGTSAAVREPVLHAVVEAVIRLEPHRALAGILSVPGSRAATHVIPPEIPPPRAA